ncbi:hypothetical protein [Kribbella sp. CA-294648]|uniref:hypothetical protein n=1 Tax=Kribbella sp. CA-294648 TaxID=3239948 RepID=UPI003D905F22
MSAVYRAVLKCYPRWWRDQHGDEVLGVLLDSADARGRTDLGDLLNLVAHAVRLRLNSSGPPTLVQGIRNRVSVIAVTLVAAISVNFLIFGEWAPWDPGTSMVVSPIGNLTTGLICYVAGLLAAIAVAVGRAQAARWLAAFSGLSALAMILPPIEQFAETFGFTRPPGAILGFLAAICVLVVAGEPRRPDGHRGAVLLLGAIPTVGVVLVSASSLQTEPWFYYRSPEQISVRVSGGILLGIGLLVIAIVLLIGGSRVWATALAVNSVPWLLLTYYTPTLGGVDALVGGAGLLAAVIGAALAAGITAVTIGRRQLPTRTSVSRSE